MDPNAFLMGAAIPSFRFDQPGAVVSGRVINRETRLQTVFGTNEVKKWPSGDPMYQLVVHIQTTFRDPMIENDNGTRAIYVKGKQFTDAVRDAVRAAGAPGVEVGGMIHVLYLGDDQASKAPIKPKMYSVQYQKAQQQPAQQGYPQQGYPQQGYGQPTQAQQAYAQTVAPPWGQAPPPSQFFPQQPRQPVGPPVYLQHSPAGTPEDQGPPPEWAAAPVSPAPAGPALSTLEQLKAAQAAAAQPTSGQPFGDQPPPF